MNPIHDPHKTNEDFIAEGQMIKGVFKIIKIGLIGLLAMLTMFAMGGCNGSMESFNDRVQGMKRPIILVAKDCHENSAYYGNESCSVILRDADGVMKGFGMEQYAMPIAKSYNVGDTLK